MLEVENCCTEKAMPLLRTCRLELAPLARKHFSRYAQWMHRPICKDEAKNDPNAQADANQCENSEQLQHRMAAFDELMHFTRTVPDLPPEKWHEILSDLVKSDDREIWIIELVLHDEVMQQNEMVGSSGSLVDYELQHCIARDQQACIMIGDCSLTRHDFLDPCGFAAEVEVMIVDLVHRRQGYASEALLAIIDYGRKVHNLTHFYAKIDADNLPSMQLFRKLGFVKHDYAECFQEYTLLFHT